METTISSKTKSIVIGPERPFVIISERINPTGRKRFGPFVSPRRYLYRKEGNLGHTRNDGAGLRKPAARHAQSPTSGRYCVNRNIKKAMLFIVLTFLLTWLVEILFFAFVGDVVTAGSISIFIPMIMAFVQNFIYKEPLKEPLGISFKLKVAA